MRSDCLRFKYVCPRESDRFTIPYLPALSLLCDAHVNIIKVVAEEWIKYLLKCATKRGPTGYLKAHELPLQCALHSLDPIDREVALRFIQVTPWSANEQTLYATDTPIFETSSIVSHIDSKPPHLRTMLVHNHGFGGDSRADWTEMYESRPDVLVTSRSLLQYSFEDFWRLLKPLNVNEMKKIGCFDINLFSLALQHQADNPGCEPASCFCPLMACKYRTAFDSALNTQHILLLQDHNELVRFSVYNPLRHLNALCFTRLMKEIPFKNEALLAQDGNYVRAAIRYHLIDTPERLHQRIAANFRLRFASPSLTVESIKQISKAISVKMMSRTSSLAAPSRRVDMERAAIFVREIDTTLNPDVVLDARQLETVQNIITSQHGLLVISGDAGTGKSLPTKLLATQLACRGVALTATTGNAACPLSCLARTVHTTFSIHSAVYLDANFANSPECMLFISKCSVFFIDEFSMLHNRNFDTVLARIMKAQGLTNA
jgi:hypothetical protein